MGELTISDISATGLGQSSPDDDVSKTSPYVLFEIGNEEHKTKKEKKVGSEVSWDGETITIKSKSGDSLAVSHATLCSSSYLYDSYFCWPSSVPQAPAECTPSLVVFSRIPFRRLFDPFARLPLELLCAQ